MGGSVARAVRSIRARIAFGFLVVLALLCLVAAAALLSGRTVNTSFRSYHAAQDARQRVAAAAERATLLQFRVAEYARSEVVQDRTAANAVLSALHQMLSDSTTDLLQTAAREAVGLSPTLDQVAAAVIARRDAGASLADSATSLATALTAIQETAARRGVEDADSAVLRTQSAAQRASLFAARYQVSESPADLNAAASETVRLSAGLDDLGRLFTAEPRLLRQLAAAQALAGQVRGAVDGLEVGTRQRAAAIARLDDSIGRIRAGLETAQRTLDAAGAHAEEKLHGSLDRSARFVTMVVAGALVLGVLCIVVIGRTCVSPLGALVVSVRRVAVGETEVAVPHVQRVDEIGDVARAVEALRREALRARAVEADAAALARTATAERHRAAALQAEATEQALGGVAHSVGRTAERLLAAADGLSGIAGRTSSRAEHVVAGSRQSQASAETVAAATAELAASVAEITRRVVDATDVTARVAQDAGRTEETVRSLSEAVRGVQEAVQVIAGVAERTKLLALNAAIEAAHAGAFGRGFEVVANEVKDLATQTATAAEHIAQQMRAMRTATDGSIATINGIRAAIGSVDHLTAHVASAVEAQHATMRGIVQAAGESATVATEVSAAMQAVLADASEAALSVDNLRGVAAEIAVQGGVLEAELEKVVEELRAA